MYEPLYRHRPAHRWTNGDLAAKVGADLGLPPDDEQQWILDTIFAEKAPERPASFEVGVISPRQNIKTSTLGIAALADLFVFGVERHLWTAHHGDTLKGTFNDFRAWIKSNPEYDEQVTFYEGHQDMSIVHKETGNTIDFQSRTGKAGRGLTGVKRITLDEALYLEPKHVGAVYPTMLTRPDAQVRIGSSAGLLDSEQLRRIRDRGRAGKDKRLAYVEYGAEKRPCLRADCTHAVGSEGCALDDRDLWWQANCALWQGRILEESLEDQRSSMPPEEFMREFLSWWEDPESEGGALSSAAWVDCVDVDSRIESRHAFALDASPELSSAAIVVAGMRLDGLSHVEVTGRADVADHRPGVDWVVPRLVQLKESRLNFVVHVAAGSSAEALVPVIREAGVKAEIVKGSEVPAACGLFYTQVTTGVLRHTGQRELAAAVAGASKVDVGDGAWKWARRKSSTDITPLYAATVALWVANRKQKTPNAW